MEIYAFVISEVQWPKSVSLGSNQGVGRAMRSLETLEEIHFLPLSGSDGSQGSLAYGSITQKPPKSHYLFFFYLCQIPLCLHKDTWSYI